jgi:hypothetical protein
MLYLSQLSGERMFNMIQRFLLVLFWIIIFLIQVSNSKTQAENNDFYDDEKTHQLITQKTILIGGELEKPAKIDLTSLPLRSVIVKEAVLKKDGNKFIGAYRYDGYSIYDILKNCSLKKKNQKEFRSCIDLYVTIENENGRKVVFSWGEIYYPVNRHQIIIATRVMRIVPSKTKELWPLPKNAKVVVATDLITERNITIPTKITVHSFPRSYNGKKGLKPLIADTLKLIIEDEKEISQYTTLDDSFAEEEYKTVFYGRGRGIHGISSFKGVPIKEVITSEIQVTAQNIQKMLLCFAAPDGYRCTFSYSEIVNRNDQSEVLLLELEKGTEGGHFKIFPAGDFFSDRAIKAVNEIYGISVK